MLEAVNFISEFEPSIEDLDIDELESAFMQKLLSVWIRIKNPYTIIIWFLHKKGATYFIIIPFYLTNS